MNWHEAGSAVAVCCYSVGSQNLTGRSYPYGVVGVTGENNHWLAGSNVPYTAKGEYLWPWFSVNVSSPFGSVSGDGWYVYGSQVTFSVAPTTVTANGLLGNLGATMTFVGWNGDYTGLTATNKLTVDSSKTEVAIWRTEYGPFIPAIAGSSFAAVLLVSVFMLRKVAGSRKRVATKSPWVFCSNCGIKILRKDRFCEECGSRIS
jgi:DNA-directed RNA polymerase subunit RPC12/RpoP